MNIVETALGCAGLAGWKFAWTWRDGRCTLVWTMRHGGLETDVDWGDGLAWGVRKCRHDLLLLELK